jgi:hypothetical protein
MAGKTVIDHELDTFKTLPDPSNVEYIFIVGKMGEKIEAHMQEYYPELKVRYIEQTEMRGQSHALHLAREFLDGPMLMIFGDTLVETNLSFLANESADGVAWVKAVPDPRRFGVAVVGADGWVTQIIEKPKDLDNNLVVVGFYYFKDSTALVAAIDMPAYVAEPATFVGLNMVNPPSWFVSFAYNVGVPAMSKSSVIRHFNGGDIRKAADSFLLWNKAAGKIMPGLTRRRSEERALFLKASALVATAPAPTPTPVPPPPAAPVPEPAAAPGHGIARAVLITLGVVFAAIAAFIIGGK